MIKPQKHIAITNCDVQTDLKQQFVSEFSGWATFGDSLVILQIASLALTLKKNPHLLSILFQSGINTSINICVRINFMLPKQTLKQFPNLASTAIAFLTCHTCCSLVILNS